MQASSADDRPEILEVGALVRLEGPFSKDLELIKGCRQPGLREIGVTRPA
jgi:hypothetical protein